MRIQTHHFYFTYTATKLLANTVSVLDDSKIVHVNMAATNTVVIRKSLKDCSRDAITQEELITCVTLASVQGLRLNAPCRVGVHQSSGKFTFDPPELITEKERGGGGGIEKLWLAL